MLPQARWPTNDGERINASTFGDVTTCAARCASRARICARSRVRMTTTQTEPARPGLKPEQPQLRQRIAHDGARSGRHPEGARSRRSSVAATHTVNPHRMHIVILRRSGRGKVLSPAQVPHRS